MPTANELYLDAILRHQIGIRRFSSGEAKKLLEILEKADKELISKIRGAIASLAKKEFSPKADRWKALIQEIAAIRTLLFNNIQNSQKQQLKEFAVAERDRELSILQAAIPIEYAFASVATAQLDKIVTESPFNGRLFKEWFKKLSDSDRTLIIQQIQLGLVQGESVDDIVQRLAGTKQNKFADGVLSTTRRNTVAVVRTAINHFSNAAREEVWRNNSEIIGALIWNSVLDGRTSAICRARDGHGTSVSGSELPPGIPKLIPEGARPPAHVNCRSIMVAYIDGVGLVGRRPTVTDIRTRRKREIDFRKEARDKGISIQEVRRRWAVENIGNVPADITYDEFLRKQSIKFQEDVLGKAKAKLFRENKLKLDQFVDRAGNELTLGELKRSAPEVAQAE